MPKLNTLVAKHIGNATISLFSDDQMLRVYKKYILEGDAGLIHGNRGRASNRKHSDHQEIINIYSDKYKEFGPTLASEYLLQGLGLKTESFPAI